MYCTNCGKEIDNSAFVCVHCGVKQGTGKNHCHNCGQPMNQDAAFCTGCGVKTLSNQSSINLEGFNGGTRNKITAALLCFFLGVLGIHDFYLGYKVRGVIKLVCTATLVAVPLSATWALIDLIMILLDSKTDVDGNELI